MRPRSEIVWAIVTIVVFVALLVLFAWPALGASAVAVSTAEIHSRDQGGIGQQAPKLRLPRLAIRHPAWA